MSQPVPTLSEVGDGPSEGSSKVALDYGKEPSRTGNGFLAAAATLWLVGLGHWFARDSRRAVKWLVAIVVLTAISFAAAAAPGMFPALLVLAPLVTLVTLSCAADAWRSGRRAERPRFRSAAPRFFVGILFIIAAAFVPAALPVALLLRSTIVEAFVIPTASMSPTVVAGDRLVVHKIGRNYQRWDVIAFHFPEDPEVKFIKRIAGLPGERVEIVGGAVTINGAPVNAPPGVGPYTEKGPFGRPGTGCKSNPITLAADEYFVLGDNSPIALDSRFWGSSAPGHQLGAVPANMIIGRATWTYWPPSRWKSLERAK